MWHYGNSKQKIRLTRLRVGLVVARLFSREGLLVLDQIIKVY